MQKKTEENLARRFAEGHNFSSGGNKMAQTATYCSDCYDRALKTPQPEDASLLAAEKSGAMPMTKEGTCSKCGVKTVVMSFEM